jgi:hypothetical protein
VKCHLRRVKIFFLCSLVTLSLLFYTNNMAGAVMAVMVWLLDLELPMQSVPITTDAVSSNLDQGEVYNIM